MFPTSISAVAHSWVCVCVSPRGHGHRGAGLLAWKILWNIFCWHENIHETFCWHVHSLLWIFVSGGLTALKPLDFYSVFFIQTTCQLSNDNTLSKPIFSAFHTHQTNLGIAWNFFSRIRGSAFFSLCDVLACQAVLASAQNKSFRGTLAEQPLNPIKSSELRAQKPLSPLPAGLVEICF